MFKNFDREILIALSQQTQYAQLFKDAHFALLPKSRTFGSHDVYAAQSGDVTALAWKRKDGTWKIKIVTW